jgi:hypothetical protein
VYVNVSVSGFLKDVRDRTIRNGQSRDNDIDIQKAKDVRDMTIRNGQSRDTSIDMHNKRTRSFSWVCQCQCLEIVNS